MTEQEIRDRLAAVRQAILASLPAKEYSVPGRSLVRQDLKQLRDEERDLEFRLARLASGGGITFQTPLFEGRDG